MKRQRLWYAAALLACAVLFVVTDERASVLLLCGFAIFPVLSLALLLLAVRGLELSYELPESCEAGDEITLAIALHRKSRLPLGAVEARFRLENILYGDTEEKTILLQPEEKKELSYHLPFRQEDCGYLRVSCEPLRCRDLLGLFVIRRAGAAARQSLAYPAQLRLSLTLERRPQANSEAELYDPARRGQDVSEVADLRAYRPGDTPGSIHWKLSSKLDELVVREFGYPSDYSTLLLCSIAGLPGGTAPTRAQCNAVLALAMSLSYSLMAMNLEHSVGLPDSLEGDALPVYSIESHARMTLGLLSRPPQAEGGVNALERFLRDSRRNHYTKLIYIAPDYDETLARRIAQGVDLTVIVVLEGTAAALPQGLPYAVIPVSAKDYREKVHQLLL